MSQPEPGHPHDADVPQGEPDQSRIEGAELLANEARAELRRRGLTDKQIDECALSYIAERGSGDRSSFLAWVAQQEDTD